MPALPLPPGPPPVPNNFLAQLRFGRSFIGGGILRTIAQAHDTYGDMVHYHLQPSAHIVLVRSTEATHQILVSKASSFHKGRDYADTKRGLARFLGSGLLTSDGDFWKRQRRLVAPALHTRRVDSYADAMVTLGEAAGAEWQDGQTIDVDDAMMRLTLAIVARTLFDRDVSGEAHRVGEAMTIFQHMNDRSPDLLPIWMPTRKRLRERSALRDLNAIIYGMIQQRRAEGRDHGDLLSMLLLARDEDGGAMSDVQVRDEATTLFLAGHETTANALNWTWMLLAQHPEAETKLHAELDHVLAGRAPTLADLPNLPWTEMVIKESMRLYPPAWGFGRRAIVDVEIDGFHLPKDCEVYLSPYHMHRHPALWPDPERFDPERFSPEREAAIPRMAYLPFSTGPRVCIGSAFAMMEARLLLAALARRWQLRLLSDQPIQPEPMITLRPSEGLRMRVQARQAPALRST